MAGNFYSWVKDERVLKNPSAKCTSPHPESCPYHGTKKLDKTDEVDKGAGGGADDVAEMDAAYADAVKRGDRETALRMIREAAAKAMPKTKVLDKDGLPLVVYNGGWKGNKFIGNAWFTSDKDVAIEYAGDGDVKAFFVDCESPRVIEGNGARFDEVNNGIGTEETVYRLDNEQGVKTVVFNNIHDEYDTEHSPQTVISHRGSPSIIKSADIEYDDDGNLIPLSKRFDFNNPDIRY